MDDKETGTGSTPQVITPDNPPVPNQPVYATMQETGQPTMSRREFLTSAAKVAAPVAVVGTLSTWDRITGWFQNMGHKSETAPQVLNVPSVPRLPDLPSDQALAISQAAKSEASTLNQPLVNQTASTIGQIQLENQKKDTTNDQRIISEIHNAPPTEAKPNAVNPGTNTGN